MNPFGNGSDGALNVTTGTRNLALNTKHQFTTVNVASAATISTASTTGSVLYICATESITIDGTINVANKVNHGNNSWSVTIDGVTYTSPGVQNGGAGELYDGNSQGLQSNGHGGGGAGDAATFTINSVNYYGGNGGNATGSTPNGGNSTTSTRTSNGLSHNRTNGSHSGGGSGASMAYLSNLSGSLTVRSIGGAGGSNWGANGSNGSGSLSGSGSGTWASFGLGGGGAGGRAGRAGVHVVLIAPSVVINGVIVTSGTAGQKGGNGGRSTILGNFVNSWGMPGGGGGGGNAGRITLKYGSNLTDNGSFLQGGGAAGQGGVGGYENSVSGGQGQQGFLETYSTEQLPPVANFTASPTTGARPLTVNFTNASQGATSYSWNFGDSSGSSQENPQHTYTSPGTYTVSLTVTNGAGSDTITRTSYITAELAEYDRSISGTLLYGGGVDRPMVATQRSISGTLRFGGNLRAVVLKDVEALPDKKYLYKVYDQDGSYIEVWKDVITQPNFNRELNEVGASMDLELARNSDSVGVSVSPLQTEDGQLLTTENDESLLVATESRNQIGDGSSVQYNNRVDIYVYYGTVTPLYTEAMEEILTEDDEVILAEEGAPNGRRIFTGFISDINTRYGNTDTTIVQLSSYGWDLDQFPITAANGDTTVTFNSYDPSQIAREAIDKFVADSSAYGTYTHRTNESIETTGTVVSYTFRANSYKDVLAKVLELMPSNWYYYVDLGTNTVHFRERSVTPHHLFYLGKHIKALDLRGSILDTTNRVLFTGGGDPALFRDTQEAPADRVRRSLQIYSDSRVTVPTSAEIISEGAIERGNKVQYRTTIEVLSNVYDIEGIDVGDVVGFRNFNNYVDALTMQVVGINYTPDVAQLQLETKPPTINKRLEDIYRNLQVNENQNLPNRPN